MFEILIRTPFYIWTLLIYLIFIGIKASKTNTLPLKVLMIMPIAICGWSCYTLFARYEISYQILFYWSCSIGTGICTGLWMMNRINLKFDKEKKLVEFPGSWVPLLLSMTIFSVRYFLGVSYSLDPELTQNNFFLTMELGAILITGCFAGRLLGCWKRYKVAAHERLSSK